MERRGDFGYDPWQLYGRPALAAAAALVLVVIVVLGAKMILGRAESGGPPASASPAVPIRATAATPTLGGSPVKASPLAFPPTVAAGRMLVVAGTGDLGLTLRAEPSASAPALAALPEGARLTETGPERTVDGRAWLHVRDESGNDGWVAAEFTVPAP